ncbi:kinase-like protein [Pleomassaria siparia CBS 279.74]|uniref:Kinase-like protein n=1 Tax=Pleomassaria siparia CBS 279.74 TaxID=1314801 RepID=A0A6G1KCR7_9PLEO|nr:kinase-like protein [Pleomassaria siparia CBS 279.74]
MKMEDQAVNTSAIPTKAQHPLGLDTLRRISKQTNVMRRYLLIRSAGSGGFADVFFALPKSALTFEQVQRARREDRQVVVDLFPQLVAVKVYKVGRGHTLEGEICVLRSLREICALLSLREMDQQAFPSRCVPMLDHDENRFRWLTTPAYNGSLSLSSLHSFCLSNGRIMPEELVFHLFIQIFDSVIFLHKNGIVHRDLYLGNMMLDLEHQDYAGFPNVVIIDFGLSKPNQGTPRGRRKAEQEDCASVCKNLHILCQVGACSQHAEQIDPGTCGHSSGWLVFVEFLKDNSTFCHYRNLHELLKVSGPVAIQGRGQTTEFKLKIIKDLIESASRSSIENLEKDLLQVVKIGQI